MGPAAQPHSGADPPGARAHAVHCWAFDTQPGRSPASSTGHFWCKAPPRTVSSGEREFSMWADTRRTPAALQLRPGPGLSSATPAPLKGSGLPRNPTQASNALLCQKVGMRPKDNWAKSGAVTGYRPGNGPTGHTELSQYMSPRDVGQAAVADGLHGGHRHPGPTRSPGQGLTPALTWAGSRWRRGGEGPMCRSLRDRVFKWAKGRMGRASEMKSQPPEAVNTVQSAR